MIDSLEKSEKSHTGDTLNSISLKRQVTVKSLVTEAFREKARTELSDELNLIEAQSQQLEAQFQGSLRQLENMAKSGENVSRHLDQLNAEAQERRTQLANVKMQVANNLSNIDRVQNGETIVTGVLENYVTVGIGDNIYDKLRGAEILIQDGIIQSITD
jgi:SMC interacting uncharacterized protein involved in chromosome segregation